MNIHIFYSHYNITKTDNKGRPVWFDYEKCFVNLLNTIKDRQNVTLHVVMDGIIEDNWISKYSSEYIAHEITTNHSMESITTGVYSEIRKLVCSDVDLIYVLENDYLHAADWVDEVLSLFQTYEMLNYVSLYDHNDKYFLPMYDNLSSKIITTENHHWRTAPSTCGSYITTKRIFDEDYSVHTGENIPIGDHHKWLWLNDNRDRFILTPIPGLSTHCMDGLLSPTINWEAINN